MKFLNKLWTLRDVGHKSVDTNFVELKALKLKAFGKVQNLKVLEKLKI